MKKQLFRRIMALFLFALIAGVSSVLIFNNSDAAKEVKRTLFKPVESEEVLANPYIGFVADARTTSDIEQPVRLAHANMTWRELEPEKGKYAFEEVEKKFNMAYWKEQGVHLVIRVILDYPRSESHMDIPDWLYEEIGHKGKWYSMDYGEGFSPDYTHPALIKNHELLLKALGKRYNNNPQIAFVQLGSVGHWGEWHTKNDGDTAIVFPKRSITDQYATHYAKSFPDKHLLMRRPHEIAVAYGMGLYNDAFGDKRSTIDEFYKWSTKGYTSWLTKEKEPAMLNYWTKAPSGGEFMPDSNFMKDSRIEETLRQARMTHVSWLGPSAPYREEDTKYQSNIDRFLKTIGYRFVITEESHEETVKAGQSLNIELQVKNRGVAPFYYEWPFELSLSDQNGTIAVKMNTDQDIRKWLPGTSKAVFSLPLPKTLAAGTYTVNAAIIDPSNGKPGVDFAIEERREDGRFALGTVKIMAIK
ncbi:DUF4832 domain-containing protein [Paenibacillus sp. GCM10027626]|uniref:DUF4832 domain-containing protein n=1 Tax=Paenibacillus sp. GCM10027626 TaxID=3273411 RepID=UPI003638A1FA